VGAGAALVAMGAVFWLLVTFPSLLFGGVAVAGACYFVTSVFVQRRADRTRR
jgi:hypothetical protein